MKRLNINLADRSYEILINRNLLSKIGKLVSEIFSPSRVVVITHPSVRQLFGDKIESGLTAAGYSPDASRHDLDRARTRSYIGHRIWA